MHVHLHVCLCLCLCLCLCFCFMPLACHCLATSTLLSSVFVPALLQRPHALDASNSYSIAYFDLPKASPLLLPSSPLNL